MTRNWPVEGNAQTQHTALASFLSWLASWDSGKLSSAGVIIKITFLVLKFGALIPVPVETGIGSRDESEATVICIAF